MRILSPRVHGIIDYLLVALFLLAPALLSLGSIASGICYGFAAAHLVLSLLTDTPMGAAKWIPLSVHGAIELAAGAALLVVPWLFAPAWVGPARPFFTAAGAIVCGVWLLSRYAPAAPTQPRYDRYDR